MSFQRGLDRGDFEFHSIMCSLGFGVVLYIKQWLIYKFWGEISIYHHLQRSYKKYVLPVFHAVFSKVKCHGHRKLQFSEVPPFRWPKCTVKPSGNLNSESKTKTMKNRSWQRRSVCFQNCGLWPTSESKPGCRNWHETDKPIADKENLLCLIKGETELHLCIFSWVGRQAPVHCKGQAAQYH